MELKQQPHSHEYVDAIVENNIHDAQKIIDNYTIEPTFNAKKSLIEFSRDVIYQYIYAFITNDFNNNYSIR